MCAGKLWSASTCEHTNMYMHTHTHTHTLAHTHEHTKQHLHTHVGREIVKRIDMWGIGMCMHTHTHVHAHINLQNSTNTRTCAGKSWSALTCGALTCCSWWGATEATLVQMPSRCVASSCCKADVNATLVRSVYLRGVMVYALRAAVLIMQCVLLCDLCTACCCVIMHCVLLCDLCTVCSCVTWWG